jgi:hypothetical protein
MGAARHPIWDSCRLWSLQDMLETWGYNYLIIGTALAYAETELEKHRAKTGGATAGHGTSILDPDDQAATLLEAKCDEVISLAADQDLGVITTNCELLKAKISTTRKQKPRGLELYTNDILDGVRRIKNDLIIILSRKYFYYLKPGSEKNYGKPELFGPAVAKKFKAARDDIERAGNCLALGEPTACVLHLNRVMEIAIHRLARKLNITPDAKDNMGSMLGKMTEPIRNLPDKTEPQKRKKEKWAECRTNLYHIKMAWRDPSSHGKQSYDEKQAADIFRRVKDFMQQLATL